MATSKELFETLLETKSIKIERITSKGEVTAEGEWYDQEDDEFVILSEGEAILEFEDKTITLQKGDYLLIKAHQRHRVSYTSDNALWIAIFFRYN